MPRQVFLDVVATLEAGADAINGLSGGSEQVTDAVYRSSEGSHFHNQFQLTTLFEFSVFSIRD
jgi:hypothetical protein